MATKTNLLPEREYIAVLGLVMPLVVAKRDLALTPGDFDSRAYALEVIESLAAQRLDSSVLDAAPENAESEYPIQVPQEGEQA